MSDTEFTLYWATSSWLEKDVGRETGIADVDTCMRMWTEIQRVRDLFQATLRMPIIDPAVHRS